MVNKHLIYMNEHEVCVTCDQLVEELSCSCLSSIDASSPNTHDHRMRSLYYLETPED